MPRAEFEPTISTFERPKTVLASDRSAIETGHFCGLLSIIQGCKETEITKSEMQTTEVSPSETVLKSVHSNAFNPQERTSNGQ
jgi:hypothetical protein